MLGIKKIQLTDVDQEKIATAVDEAEGKTSGEIVPYLVHHSDRYEIAYWIATVIFMSLALLGALLIFLFYDGWGFGWLFTGIGMSATLILFAGLGILLTWAFPPLKRFLIGKDLLAMRVHARAMQAFVEEEVFNTQDRTGILLFISSFEHRIEVIGDAGINAKVQQQDWEEVVERIQHGIKTNEFVTGLMEAIEMCGNLLERKEVLRREDDTNELSNALRIRDE